MIVLTVLIITCLAAANAATLSSERIVGGSVTTIDRYPQMCALLFSSDLSTFFQTCGGSILNSRSILTAAHWLTTDANRRTRIRVGSTWANSGGVVHAVSTPIFHPSYNAATFLDADIAIARTATTISFNNNVQMARIAGANYNLADNQVVWAAGWGRTSHGGSPSNQLRHVQIWSVNQAICKQRYGQSVITDNMLCAGWLDVGGRGQCNQDSGSPLFHNGVVVGVCSFGGDCGSAFLPNVNVRVSRFTSWIQANS